MKKKLFTIYLFAFSILFVSGQVGIGTDTPDTSSMLDVHATNKGFLPPRVQLTSTKDVTSIENPAAGLLIYEPDGFSETINSVVYNRPKGIYMFDGTEWMQLLASNDNNTSWEVRNQTGVKIDVNQSSYITLSGAQSYGLLMLNAGVTINPTYSTGIWPPESDEPSDIITTTTGEGGALLLENPVAGQPNYFRMDFSYQMGNNPPQETRYFTVEIVSVQSGETVFTEAVVVPGLLNTGQAATFQIFFPTIPDSSSLGTGYKILFKVDTAGSQGLPNNISVKLNHIERIS